MLMNSFLLQVDSPNYRCWDIVKDSPHLAGIQTQGGDSVVLQPVDQHPAHIFFMHIEGFYLQEPSPSDEVVDSTFDSTVGRAADSKIDFVADSSVGKVADWALLKTLTRN